MAHPDKREARAGLQDTGQSGDDGHTQHGDRPERAARENGAGIAAHLAASLLAAITAGCALGPNYVIGAVLFAHALARFRATIGTMV